MPPHSSDLGSAPADRAIRMAAALSAEVAALRERVAILEMISDRKGLISRGEVDRFLPDEEESRHLRTARLGLIDRVFRALRVGTESES